MLNNIKKRLSGSIKKRLYLLTGIVGVIMLIMVLVFIWSGNTLSMITAIARFERTHTISRVEAIYFFERYYDHKKTSDLNLYTKKWAITQSYHRVFGNLLEMRTTKSKKEFADIVEKTFAEADRNISEILVNRIDLLYWHPLIIGMVDNARRAHKLGLLLDDHVKIILGSDSAAIRSAEFREIERIAESFRILEDDFTTKSGMLGSEITFIIKLLSIGMLFLSVCLTSLIAFLTIRSISLPIGRFIAYSKDVAGGNIDAEMPGISVDELLSLSESMAILLSLNQRLKHEVDEKTQMANELRVSEERYHALIMNLDAGIVVHSSDTSIVMNNPKSSELLGLSDDQMKGKTAINPDWKFIDENNTPLPPEDYPVNRIISSKKPISTQILGISRPGTKDIIWVTVNGFLMYDSTGSFSEIVISFFDVTERKHAEEERLKLHAQLQQSRKMDAIGQLAGGVAHDFNNMLGGIMGAAQILQNPSQNLDKKKLEYVKMILDASQRAADLTAKLLAFGRKGKITSTSIDIHTIVDDTLALLNRTIDKKITISVSKNAENSIVIGDDSALQNSLLNLGINASHAMQDGGELRIETRNITLNENYCSSSPFEISEGNYIEIEVRDTGTGIAPENIDKIFEPFFSTKEIGKGTGLGLAVVYGTIQDHHGAINVYSEIGTGTVFHLYLPCPDEAVKKVRTEGIVLEGLGKILLVDDEELIRVTGKYLLEEIGYTVLLAENGLEAVEIFKRNNSEIDLVILDMIMPKMNGSEAFLKMREIDNNCKVVISSGFTKDENLNELKKAGLTGFIQKPFRNFELSKLLAEILGIGEKI